eukprot:m.227537 g.227537  ORF g.227537 m.227537 type:complete len:395 (+) comp17243_c0_seq1:32-1216(+)
MCCVSVMDKTKMKGRKEHKCADVMIVFVGFSVTCVGTGTRLHEIFAAVGHQLLRRGLGIAKQPVDLGDLVHSNAVLAVDASEEDSGGEQLHGVAEGGFGAHFGELGKGLVRHGDALGLCADLDDLGHLGRAVGLQLDDHDAVQQINGHAVRRLDIVRAADGAEAAVGGKDDNGGQGGLEGAVEEGEALEIEHVDLVDKEYAGHKLSYALVNVPVDHLIDLAAQLLGDFGLARLHQRAHHRHDVLPTLGLGIGNVQVMQCDILHHFLLLVHITLGQRHVLLRFQIKLGGKRVGAALALHGAAVGLNVDHVAHRHFLLLQCLVDGGVQLELLCALGGLQADDHVADRLAVAAKRVFCLLGGQLGDLTLVHLLGLLDAQSNGASKVFHENLCWLHLG